MCFKFSLKCCTQIFISKECYKNIDKGIELYKKLKKNNSADYNFSSESETNSLGYEFLKDDKIQSAIKIFTLNVSEFPNSGNAYDSLGKAYFNNQEYVLSKQSYLKSLELMPAVCSKK
ncbi:tetratricopeptide (TPR) repeat protein [Chryseobacterium sp. H1D6B]|uniref:tetratricopeptide repeat protein n=1 Tax=Chryseobacterium sp. H1D6B TaxID=2940588 RepID=UPI0015CA54D0|nr:hypothetical protein [Chryseobacterium sp. H1D6B]MDH6254138.1 tetratricopeptide (TPR) repeat protein [Chryseobacterium sp. H1D6B]